MGDLAETVALVWPAKPGANREPELSEVVDTLRTAARAEVQRLIEGWLDALDAGRPLGAAQAGHRRPARRPFGAAGQTGGGGSRAASRSAEVEELWHALSPPYEDLFAWLEGHGEKPTADAPGRFRPVMLAQAIDEAVDFARATIPPTTPPNGSGTASGSRRSTSGASAGSIPAPAT